MNNDPKLYYKNHPLQKRDAAEYMERQSKKFKWKQREKVLDIGCGPGDITKIILRPHLPPDASVIGCDISKEMIDYATSLYENDRLSFSCMDIEQEEAWTDFGKGSFHKIFSFYCLHWVSDFKEAAKNMYVLLKSGGELFLLFLYDNPAFDLFKKVSETDQWRSYAKRSPAFKRLQHHFCASEYSKILTETGFKDVDVEVKHKDFTFDSMEKLLGSLNSVDTMEALVPEDMKNNYHETLRRIILEDELATVNPEDGRVTIQYKLAEIHAIK